MEQKIKRKRQSAAMIQASDARNTSAKMRTNSGSRRELHGTNLSLKTFVLDYVKHIYCRLRWTFAIYNESRQ